MSWDFKNCFGVKNYPSSSSVYRKIGRVDFVNFQIPKMSSAKKLWHDLVSQKIFW